MYPLGAGNLAEMHGTLPIGFRVRVRVRVRVWVWVRVRVRVRETSPRCTASYSHLT